MKAVIYARCSDSPDATRNAGKKATGAGDATNSAERQVEVCRNYLKLRGYELAHEPFVDAYKSGKDPMEKRPGAGAMLAFLRKRPQPATIVVMTELDRGWRDPIDALATLQVWTKDGIAIHFAAMGGNAIDTSTPIGEYVFGQLVLFARLQRRQIGERTKRRMVADQRAGRRLSDKLPYGFKLDPDSPPVQRLDPESGKIVAGEPSEMIPDWGPAGEMEQVKRILEYASQGCGPGTIARHMNNIGVFCRGGPWNHNTVANIIRRGMPDPIKFPEPNQ